MPAADAEQLDAYAAEVRAAFERMIADAAIAVEVNPSSTAADDVELVRTLLVGYASRIVELEGVLTTIAGMAANPGEETVTAIAVIAIRALEGSANDG